MKAATSLLLTAAALVLTGGMAIGQNKHDDPVLMTVNGKPVTKSEFEYAYHKNNVVDGAVEKTTVEQYAQMFLNYKLKVEAALAARLDTLDSYQREFHLYRDMQLTPYLVDSAYIDSVAHVVYDNTLKRMEGKDLIKTAHILLRVPQSAGEADKERAKAKADSLYQAIKGGADFAELAKRYSEDPGSAQSGGELPFIGPGAVVKEYEGAAYALKKGEVAAPVLSSFGYHIIKMVDRKPLDPFEKAEPEILKMLKAQNIEEASSEHRINRIVTASNGRLNREAVLDSVMNAHVADNASLRYLIKEYHDGLLLYEVSKREVWDVAAADTTGLIRWYKTHKKQYRWDSPRFSGFVYHCKDKAQEKAVKNLLKKAQQTTDWKQRVKATFNKDSVTVAVSGPYLCKEGENRYVDKYAFKSGKAQADTPKGYAVTGVVGKVQKQPKSWTDVSAQVVTDYQADREKVWVDGLRARFPYTINANVLKTVR